MPGNFLKAIDAPVVPAYGKHVIVPKQIYRQDSAIDDSVVYVGMLGEGPWNRLVQVFIGGGSRNPSVVFDIDDSSKNHPKVQIEFLAGDRNQSPSTFFPDVIGGVGFSMTTVIAIKLLAGHGLLGEGAITGGEPPGLDIRIIAETLKVVEYDATGQPLNAGARIYSTKPSWCTIDFLLNKHYGLGIDNSEIDWQSWFDFQTYADEQISDNFSQSGRFEIFPLYNRINQSNEVLFTVGATFTVTQEITVTGLGRQFKADSAGQHRVRIWDESTGVIVVGDSSTVVNPATPLVKVGSVKLVPGKTYVIGVTEGNRSQVEAADPWTNLRAATSNEPEIVVGQSRWTNGFGKPITNDPTGDLYGDPIIEFTKQQSPRQIERFQMNVALKQERDAITSLGLLEQHCFFKVVERNGLFSVVSPKPKAAQSGNKWYVPDANGQPDLTKPLFHFNKKNIARGSFKFDTIPTEDLPGEVIGEFRDLDDPLLKQRRVKLTRPGGKQALTLDLGVMRRSQAVRIVSAFTRAVYDLRKRTWFKALPNTLEVTKLDAIQISHPDAGWEYQLFQVHQINDSASGMRQLVSKEDNPALYSDTDFTPLDSLLQTTIIDLSLPPPHVPLSSIQLQSAVREQPNDSPALFIQGIFLLIYPAIEARLWVKDAAGSFDDTGIDAGGSFLYGPVKQGISYTIKLVAKNPLGVKADFNTAPEVTITPTAPPGELDPGIKISGVELFQLVQFATGHKGAIQGLASRLGSLLAGPAGPFFLIAFIVAGAIAFKIRNLERHQVWELEEIQTLAAGDILIDLRQTDLLDALTVWSRTNYMNRRSGPAGILQNISGSVLLQCLIFDVVTNGIWLPDVSLVADLPGGASTNELRLVTGTNEVFRYDGSVWNKIGNVLGKAEKETMARRRFIGLFTQETSQLTVTTAAKEIHTRVVAGSEGIATPANRTFAISNLDLRFNPGTVAAPPTTDRSDDFEIFDSVRWEEVHLDASGSVTVTNSIATIDNSGAGDFGGTADTGSGYVWQLPDAQLRDDGQNVMFDHDFTITVKLGTAPSGAGDNALIIVRSSNAAGASSIGVRYKNGQLILITREFDDQAITEDASGLAVTLQDGDYIRLIFDGARLQWQHSVDKAAWTTFTGSSNNRVATFPLAKLWLAAGSPAGSSINEFDDFEISVNEPSEQPTPTDSFDPEIIIDRLPRIGGGQPRNLVFNPSGQVQNEGWVVSNTALAPGRYLDRDVFEMVGPQTFPSATETVLRTQTINETLTVGDTYILSCNAGWTNANEAGGGLQIIAVFLDSSSLEISRITIDLLIISPLQAIPIHASGLVPTGWTSTEIRIISTTAGLTMTAASAVRIWGIQFERAQIPNQTFPSRPNDERSAESTKFRATFGLDPTGVIKNTGPGRIAGTTVEFLDNNDDATIPIGTVKWQDKDGNDGFIYYGDQAFPISKGQTSVRWISWTFGDAVFTTHTTKPARIENRWTLCEITAAGLKRVRAWFVNDGGLDEEKFTSEVSEALHTAEEVATPNASFEDDTDGDGKDDWWESYGNTSRIQDQTEIGPGIWVTKIGV